ncbi:hypothetical protein BDV11DRAFT_192849 [Aspergillus similis]
MGTRRYARLFKSSHSSRSIIILYLVSSLSLAGPNSRLEMTNINFSSNSLRFFEESRKSDKAGGDGRRGEWLSSDA